MVIGRMKVMYGEWVGRECPVANELLKDARSKDIMNCYREKECSPVA
jgi:hypothetical protein